MAKGFASKREFEICNEVEALGIRANQIRTVAEDLLEESNEDTTATRAGIIMTLCDALQGEIDKIAAFIKNPEAQSFEETEEKAQ